MKARLALLLPWALVAGLAFALVQSHRAQTAQQAAIEKLARTQAELRFDLKTRTAERDALQRAAATLDTQLGSAKTRTTAAQQELAQREQREAALLHELAQLRQTPPPAVPDAAAAQAMQTRVQALETQLTDLLTRALAEAPTPRAPSAADPRRVVRLGPEGAFVVSDYGTTHGARLHEIISIQRGTSTLAEAQISHASPQFSIAQVQPATLKGQLQTGDLVVFTK